MQALQVAVYVIAAGVFLVGLVMALVVGVLLRRRATTPKARGLSLLPAGLIALLASALALGTWAVGRGLPTLLEKPVVATTALAASAVATEELGRRFANHLATNDIAAAMPLFDCPELIRRGMQGLTMSDADLAAFTVGACGSFLEQMFAGMDDIEVSYRGLAERDEHAVARIRLVMAEGGFNFFDLTVGELSNGEVRIVDFYSLVSGEYVSESLRKLYLAMQSTVPSTGSLRHLTQRDRLVSEHGDEMVRFVNLASDGDATEALALFETLPPELQKDKALLLQRLVAAERVDDATYEKAIADLQRLHPDDPASHVASIDRYFLLERYADAIATVELVAKSFPDPYFDFLLASIHLEAGELDEAKSRSAAAIAAEPTLLSAHFVELNIAIEEDDMDTTEAKLVALRDELGQDLEDAAFDEIRDMPAFVAAQATQKAP